MQTPAPVSTAPAPAPNASIDAKRQADFNKSLDSWIGAKVQELVAKLGPPTSRARQANGAAVYVYVKSTKVTGSAGPSSFSCIVRYTLDERSERVTGHQIEGC